MKKRIWIAAAAVIMVLTWSFWPRPLLRSGAEKVYFVAYWDGSQKEDTIELSAEEEAALVEVLSGCRRRVKSLDRGSYSMDEYPLEIGLHGPDIGGGWHVTAGPGDAFVYDGGSRVTWRILESEQLWRELTELLPVEP